MSDEAADSVFETEVRDGVLRVRREGAIWLSTGWAGGRREADAAYNVSVPEGFDRTDLDAYLAERLETAGFDDSGPALLTGVDLRHARGARLGPVAAVATAGLSNPAALPVNPDAERRDGATALRGSDADSPPDPGTVNLIVATDRALDGGALANLLAVAVEAKTATLLAETGFPGTTSDAAVAGCDPAGEPAAFSGSATEVGACARACVREAVTAGLDSRYGGTDEEIPESVADADHGAVTDRRAAVFEP
ncbi:adenosylcobinamide amidohydrolase [Halorussus sp. AFM4]|uniref:adenosylcobinamide amidohydrolase n=1 Tax=Halorussus sp. AFM4 TaxID=3421651 RepID=UPI003EB7AA17